MSVGGTSRTAPVDHRIFFVRKPDSHHATRNFQMQLSEEFASHTCAQHRRTQSGEGFRVVSHAVLGARVNANRLSELVATQNSDCSGVAEEFGLTV